MIIVTVRSMLSRFIYALQHYLTEKTGSFAPSVNGGGLDDELDLGQVAAGSILLLGHFNVLHYFLFSLSMSVASALFSLLLTDDESSSKSQQNGQLQVPELFIRMKMRPPVQNATRKF